MRWRQLLALLEFTDELAQGQLDFLVLFDGLRRVALKDETRTGHTGGDAAFGGHLGSVCNLDMAIDAHLSSDHALGANGGGAGDAGLGGHNGVVPDVDVVGDLDEVVQLHAPAQHRRSKGGPVDGGPGSNFASFPQHDIADLRHFFVPR